MYKLLSEVLLLATRNTTHAPLSVDSGAFADVDAATLAGGAVALATVGGAAGLGAALLPGQVALGLTTAGGFVALGEVKRRTGSYLPFLDDEDSRARKQARADKRNAARDADLDTAVA